ncbi:MAG: hypothetical protein AB3N16_07195, partial [Flavobacteriaceae bacterium]
FAISGLLQGAAVPGDAEMEMHTTLKDHFMGAWEYQAKGAPPEYSSGLLLIVQENDEFIVQVQMAHGVLNATDIKTQGKNLSFKLNIEGQDISVSLTAKGDTMTGESVSPDGTFPISATRTIKVE